LAAAAAPSTARQAVGLAKNAGRRERENERSTSEKNKRRLLEIRRRALTATDSSTFGRRK
jgi:hypothetical protein